MFTLVAAVLTDRLNLSCYASCTFFEELTGCLQFVARIRICVWAEAFW